MQSEFFNAIVFHQHGSADVLRWERQQLLAPGKGELQLRHTAIGVNFIDIYDRSGLYPRPLPETPGRWYDKYRAEKLWLLGLEFKTFVNALIAIPCQLVRQARGLIFRVLAYNPHQATFFRLVDALHC